MDLKVPSAADAPHDDFFREREKERSEGGERQRQSLLVKKAVGLLRTKMLYDHV